jgi:hypothetical protein
LSEIIVGMLGSNPTQEHFRLAAYYLTDLATRGKPSLLNDPVTAYVNDI